MSTVKLSDITTSHNPRRPCPALQDALVAEGYEGQTMLDLIHNLALDPDPSKRAEFCRLIETYEGEEVPDGIVNLAKSRAEMEIQEIMLRDFRAKVKGTDQYVTRYGIVAGERRCIACAYNYAKHGLKPELGATIKKLTVSEAYAKAIEENAQRRSMSDLEYGRIFHGYREEINPATGKKWSLKEIAEKLHLDYQFVRSREGLTYLPPADQSRLESGRGNVTKAIEKGLRLKQGKSAEVDVARKENRQRTLPLKAVQQLFDEMRVDGRGDYRDGYLDALCKVMGVDYSIAVEESKKRVEAAKTQEELEKAALVAESSHVA